MAAADRPEAAGAPTSAELVPFLAPHLQHPFADALSRGCWPTGCQYVPREPLAPYGIRIKLVRKPPNLTGHDPRCRVSEQTT
jgi:hypothetical protein